MSRRADIVFVKPVASRQLYGDLGQFDLPAVEPPLWAALLAAYMRERGYGVELIDPEVMDMDMAQAAEQTAALNPCLVCVVVAGMNPSASTMSMTGVRAFLAAFKTIRPDIPVALTGIHPNALPERTLREEQANFVILGEALHTLPPLLTELAAGGDTSQIPGLCRLDNGAFLSTPAAPLWTDLGNLPMPAWDMLPMSRYRAHNWHCFGAIDAREPYAVIYTTLGCPYHCNFCCTNSLFGKTGIRYRSPDRVIEEIDWLVSRHGVRNIKIQDEMFVLNRRHVTRLCRLIREHGHDLNIWAYARVNTVDRPLLDEMKAAGINWLAYGFESGSKAVLEAATKGYNLDSVASVVRDTREAGIHILGNYMFGLPDDDMDSMRATLDLALEINAEWGNFYTVMALPGTELYDEAIQNGWQLPQTWAGYSQYGYDTLPLPTRHLTAAQVLAFRDEAFHQYHTHSAYLARIEAIFGPATVEHLKTLTQHRLRRRLLE